MNRASIPASDIPQGIRGRCDCDYRICVSSSAGFLWSN